MEIDGGIVVFLFGEGGEEKQNICCCPFIDYPIGNCVVFVLPPLEGKQWPAAVAVLGRREWFVFVSPIL